jgi:hypothetical protein
MWMRAAGGCALMLAVAAAVAAPGAPLRADHPLIGTWRITLPDGSCSETYRIRADGTSLVFSHEEVAESNFVVSDQPDKDGFYEETDTIIKDNGKLDCSGQVTTPGKPVTNYLQFHPSGNMFVMCVERSFDRCIGPCIRVRGNVI